MKAVILAGGQGTRLSEETGMRPKPLVEIGGRPRTSKLIQSRNHVFCYVTEVLMASQRNPSPPPYPFIYIYIYV